MNLFYLLFFKIKYRKVVNKRSAENCSKESCTIHKSNYDTCFLIIELKKRHLIRQRINNNINQTFQDAVNTLKFIYTQKSSTSAYQRFSTDHQQIMYRQGHYHIFYIKIKVIYLKA
ncbi:hypothetical protein BpHYR1_042230 [Brachionus plicatilis]|uniref:Uncharacterized protein n=1 Tax=Brachionus plicatilis TaxID=10195 RepID=A0A3M7PFU7_BRAPC|nr:hypothetical protein BpHYR1_042230 [Brachionus plicatilis]